MKKINNALIKDYTTYKLSGQVKEVIIPSNILELKEAIRNLGDKKYKIIGNGSNLIISESYDGVLIKLDFDNLVIDGTKVKVGASYSLSKLSMECAKKGLSGLEFACGIPGTVGGAIYMNAGAYGSNISDVLKSVTVLDKNYEVKVLDASLLELGYRDSIFKNNDYVILEGEFVLNYKNSDAILNDIKDIMASRREKQPLEYPSAGSVFRNPEGYSAGRLIEKAGLKGLRVGDAEVSLKHANFIVNRGSASAEDVISLIDIIKDKVSEDGIMLECEQEILR